MNLFYVRREIVSARCPNMTRLSLGRYNNKAVQTDWRTDTSMTLTNVIRQKDRQTDAFMIPICP